jgi:hypothetical protein
MTTKQVFEFAKQNIASRLRSYDEEYCFDLSLVWSNGSNPEFKIAIHETGYDNFVKRIDQAYQQGVAMKADRLVYREFEDRHMTSPPERSQFRQEIPFKVPGGAAKETKPRKPKQPEAPVQQSLGAADVEKMIENSNQKKSADESEQVRIRLMEINHQQAIDAKDKTINELTEAKAKEITELTVAKEKVIKELTEKIADLEDELQERENGTIFGLDRKVAVELGSGLVQNFVRKNPSMVAGIFGVPEEVLKLAGDKDEAAETMQGANGSPATQPARQPYYDNILQYCENLPEDKWQEFWSIILTMSNDPATQSIVFDLLKEKIANNKAM